MTSSDTDDTAGREVRLRLGRPVLGGHVVRVSYRRPSTNPLRGASGNLAASFGLRDVENETDTAPEPVPALPLAGVLALAVVLALGGLRRRRA